MIILPKRNFFFHGPYFFHRPKKWFCHPLRYLHAHISQQEYRRYFRADAKSLITVFEHGLHEDYSVPRSGGIVEELTEPLSSRLGPFRARSLRQRLRYLLPAGRGRRAEAGLLAPFLRATRKLLGASQFSHPSPPRPLILPCPSAPTATRVYLPTTWRALVRQLVDWPARVAALPCKCA